MQQVSGVSYPLNLKCDVKVVESGVRSEFFALLLKTEPTSDTVKMMLIIIFLCFLFFMMNYSY